jgi:hypothetical protein
MMRIEEPWHDPLTNELRQVIRTLKAGECLIMDEERNATLVKIDYALRATKKMTNFDVLPRMAVYPAEGL